MPRHYHNNSTAAHLQSRQVKRASGVPPTSLRGETATPSTASSPGGKKCGENVWRGQICSAATQKLITACGLRLAAILLGKSNIQSRAPLAFGTVYANVHPMATAYLRSDTSACLLSEAKQKTLPAFITSRNMPYQEPRQCTSKENSRSRREDFFSHGDVNMSTERDVAEPKCQTTVMSKP
jgi:hypothetical protein